MWWEAFRVKLLQTNVSVRQQLDGVRERGAGRGGGGLQVILNGENVRNWWA